MVPTVGSVLPVVLLSFLFAMIPHVGSVRRQFFCRVPAGLYHHKKMVQQRAVYSFFMVFIGMMVSTTVLQVEETGVTWLELMGGVFGMGVMLLFIFRVFTGTALGKIPEAERGRGDSWQPGPMGVSRWLAVMLLLLLLTLGVTVAFYGSMPDKLFLFGGLRGQGAVGFSKNYVAAALPVLIEVMASCLLGFLSAAMLPQGRRAERPGFDFFGRALSFMGSMVGLWGLMTTLAWAGLISYGELTVMGLYAGLGAMGALLYAPLRTGSVSRLPDAEGPPEHEAEREDEPCAEP